MSLLEIAKRKMAEIEFEKKTREITAPLEILDAFFSKVFVPRLSSLHMAGRLPDLATCPLWSTVDSLWGVPAPDAERVKQAMIKAIEAYETGEKNTS